MQWEKSAVGVTVKAVPLPKVTVRAYGAVEFATSWCCEKCRDTAWRGVMMGVIKSITVYGEDAAGEVRDTIVMTLDDNSGGTVEIECDGGASILSALDGGLGEALRRARRSFERRGLKTYARYALRDDIEADPQRKEEVWRLLKLKASRVGPWAAGCTPRKVLEVTPAKDGGISFEFWRAGKG